MSDAITLIRSPTQPLAEFNAELRERCGELPITDFQLAIIDGQPAVTLLSADVEATEDDLRDAQAADPKSDLRLGDLIPDGDPLLVQVTPLDARTEKDAKSSRGRLDKLYDRAAGEIERVITAVGEMNEWVPNIALAKIRPDGSVESNKEGHPITPEGNPVPFALTQRQVVYLAVASLAPAPANAESPEDEA